MRTYSPPSPSPPSVHHPQRLFIFLSHTHTHKHISRLANGKFSLFSAVVRSVVFVTCSALKLNCSPLGWDHRPILPVCQPLALSLSLSRFLYLTLHPCRNNINLTIAVLLAVAAVDFVIIVVVVVAVGSISLSSMSVVQCVCCWQTVPEHKRVAVRLVDWECATRGGRMAPAAQHCVDE